MNKDPLYGTGTLWKKCVYMYVQLNPSTVDLELTQHCKPTIPQLKKWSPQWVWISAQRHTVGLQRVGQAFVHIDQRRAALREYEMVQNHGCLC